MLESTRNRMNSLAKTASYQTGGSVSTSWQGQTGNQNVDTSHAGNIGPTGKFGDSFETTGSTGSVGVRGSAGGVNYSAGVSGPSFGLDGSAKGTIGTSGIDVTAKVNIDASLVKAGATAEKTIPVTLPGGEQLQVKVDLKALGEVGANGDLNLKLHIGTDGQVKIDASASGFVGAQAGLEGAVTVMHGGDVIARGDAMLSAYAGAGASASFHASLGIHGVDFGAKAAAVAGAGFGVDLEGQFDPGAAGKLVLAVAGDLAKEGGTQAEKDVVAWGKQTGSVLASTAGDVGKEAGKVAGDIGKTVSGWF
jgi:hypothetical protein